MDYSAVETIAIKIDGELPLMVTLMIILTKNDYKFSCCWLGSKNLKYTKFKSHNSLFCVMYLLVGRVAAQARNNSWVVTIKLG